MCVNYVCFRGISLSFFCVTMMKFSYNISHVSSPLILLITEGVCSLFIPLFTDEGNKLVEDHALRKRSPSALAPASLTPPRQDSSLCCSCPWLTPRQFSPAVPHRWVGVHQYSLLRGQDLKAQINTALIHIQPVLA